MRRLLPWSLAAALLGFLLSFAGHPIPIVDFGPQGCNTACQQDIYSEGAYLLVTEFLTPLPGVLLLMLVLKPTRAALKSWYLRVLAAIVLACVLTLPFALLITDDLAFGWLYASTRLIAALAAAVWWARTYARADVDEADTAEAILSAE